LLESKKRIIRWVLATVLVVDLALIVINWKLAAAPRASASEITLLKRQHALLAADVARGDQIRKDLPAVEKQCDVFVQENLRPVGSGYSSIISDWAMLAKGAGIQAEGISFRQHAPDKSGVVEVEISTSVNGDYAGVVRFINALQHSGTFYLLDGLSLGAGSAGELKLNLALRTYFRT
jgi:Tfp pilus assembly protein PilO